MKKLYIQLSSDELRTKCIDGELEHKHMTTHDYGLLLDNEKYNVTVPNMAILDFCRVGLTKKRKIKEYEHLFRHLTEKINQSTDNATDTDYNTEEKAPAKQDYSDLHYEELRTMLLNGGLHHEYIDESVYGYLLENETEFNNNAHLDEKSHTAVVEFCTTGLQRFDEYKDLSSMEIYLRVIEKQVKRNQAERDVLTAFYNPKHKRISPIAAIIVFFTRPKLVIRALHEQYIRFYRRRKGVAIVGLVVVFSTLFVTVSAAFGFNFIDLIRNAVGSPDRAATDSEGRNTVLTDNIRIYNSMAEMLEVENLNILYPAKLPVGYEFTHFEITDIGTEFMLQAIATDPYITFVITFGVDFQIDNYDYETNGIKYNVTERDGLYNAFWISDIDYYTIAVNSEITLLEIINNLQESRGN